MLVECAPRGASSLRVEPGFEAVGVEVKDYEGWLFALTRGHVKELWEDIPPPGVSWWPGSRSASTS
ncbi:MAG: hypothetical protein PVJ38_03820 [Candidatus Bathyarchaeota archaeon]